MPLYICSSTVCVSVRRSVSQYKHNASIIHICNCNCKVNTSKVILQNPTIMARSLQLALATLPLFVALTAGAPDGYVVDPSTGIGYQLQYQAQSWPVARDRCDDRGAKLAVPKTLDEYLFIQKLVRGMHYPSVTGSEQRLLVWLGIHNLDDYRQWRNVDGENINESDFHKWSRGNGEGFSDAPEEPHCAGLGAVNWLRDFWCHRRQPYVCQIKVT